MPLRRVINLAAAHLFEGADEKMREQLLFILREPFDHELSEEERAKAERRRIAMATGAYSGQAGLIGAMGMTPK